MAISYVDEFGVITLERFSELLTELVVVRLLQQQPIVCLSFALFSAQKTSKTLLWTVATLPRTKNSSTLIHCCFSVVDV